MKYSLKTIEIISFIIASLLGVIFHFIYGWSGENAVAGLFFPVNESTWEHLKLIFFPILLVSIGEFYFSYPIRQFYLRETFVSPAGHGVDGGMLLYLSGSIWKKQ